MANQALIPHDIRQNYHLNFVIKETQQSWFGSLLDNLRDALFPPKLSPLVVTSRPVRVRDIWGDYGYNKKATYLSLTLHALAIATLVAASVITWSSAAEEVKKPVEHVMLTVPPDIIMPLSPKKADTLSGGGGGGDRDKLEAPKGKPPKPAMEQFTPPAVVLRNENPKLAVEPTVVMPPDVRLPSTNLPTMGDPLANVSGPPSNGVGSAGGIGSGSGGGIGSGEGGGVGPGRGGGIGGGVFRVGGGVSAPRAIDTPDPEYSEEARKAKYQGVVVLWLIVGPDGRPRDMKVARSLGMGLDQKAIAAVRQWKFEPAMKDGRPVAVQINVEVNFRLY